MYDSFEKNTMMSYLRMLDLQMVNIFDKSNCFYFDLISFHCFSSTECFPSHCYQIWIINTL